MRVFGTPKRTIEMHADGKSVVVIDQTRLPGAFEQIRLASLSDVARAIQTMQVRGAPLIGVTAAYGMAIACAENISIASAFDTLLATRPTAVNLRWALERMRARLETAQASERPAIAFDEAAKIAEEDVACSKAIGEAGLRLLEKVHGYKGRVEVLTHCNAGWLATVDWGTALAPIYRAFDAGLSLHVWVSETRPRNQGALTAWELGAHGVPFTFVADNACGHLLARGKVDLCIVGADRVTANGDVANKVGTYLKAVAARENKVPFYVAFPESTIDWTLSDGGAIPIEERSPDEFATDVPVFNPAFDVTPARFVTAFVTERGTCAASREGLRQLYGR